MHHISIEAISAQIKQIYLSDPEKAENAIETYLEKRLIGFQRDEKLLLVDKLVKKISGSHQAVPPDQVVTENKDLDKEVLSKAFSLLLGHEVSEDELSSTELLQRMAESLNTIFTTLNQLVSLINSTLFGRQIGEETIRQVIGDRLKNEEPSKSLETYLGQINKAFLISQKAFQNTAHDMVKKILQTFAQEQSEHSKGSKIKFGVFKKAELFENINNNYQKLQKWFKSDRFMEDFLREFEKNCRKLSE